MPDWYFLACLAAGLGVLAGRRVVRKARQESAAAAAGLAPASDLAHLPAGLQQTALWALGDGGFERRVLHGVVARDGGDIEVTAFDLETLRERRGEWAWLPVEPPFRISGVVSVVVCEIDRAFPHVLMKRAGEGDKLLDDNRIERAGHLAKAFRDRLGLARAYEAELPPALPAIAAGVALPAQWRAYTRAPETVAALASAGLHATLAHAGRRDLVIELLGSLVVIYPAALDVVGADAFADLTSTALAIVDGIRASSSSPRGIEPQRASP